MSATVYTLRNAENDALYVGCTIVLPERLAAHRRERDWWPQVKHVDVEHFDSRRDAFARERELIHALKPPHNQIGAQPMPRKRERKSQPSRLQSPLRAAIKAAGLTQREFAPRIGIHETQLSYIVNGLAPDRETAERMAQHLETTVEDLFPDGVGRTLGQVAA